MDPPPKQSLFSSLSLGRASRSAKAPETLAHPLLGASTSSLNLPTTSSTDTSSNDSNPSAPPLGHRSTSSVSTKPVAMDTIANLPYKPRQRHGGGIGSIGSNASVLSNNGGSASPTLAPSVATATPSSPVTPTGIAAAPTTSTSTSTTFALPPSHSDPPAQALDSAIPTTVTASNSGSSSLTSRLQLQSLKAAGQRIGLGNGSMGMSMIDAIFDKGQLGRAKAGEGGDWGDLLRILMGGKAILLLPTTPSSSLPMTPQTLRDHIAFLSPPVPLASSSYTSKQPSNESNSFNEKEDPASNTNVLVTLSGLIGTLKGTTITFESTIPSDSPTLSALRDAATRQIALSSLRPTQANNYSSFPSFSLSSETASLPFPPPSKNGPNPSSTETKEKEKTAQGKLGRMNPFASLFGGSSTASPTLGSSPTTAPPIPTSPPSRVDSSLNVDISSIPPRSQPSSPVPSSPKPSLLAIDHGDNASILSETASIISGEGFQVTAYTVSRPIRYNETHKTLTKSVRTHARETLARLPDKVVEKVIKLVIPNTCPSSLNIGDEILKGRSDHESVAHLDFDDPTGTGERLQDFMEGIYDDLVAHYRSDGQDGLKRKGSGNVPWGRASHVQAQDGDAESDREKREKAKRNMEEQIEKDASEGTERVEALVCRLLYNRMFSPLESDDAKHDEALASRIAALNMLDLSLDHLGLITHPEGEQPEGTVAKGLADIVDRIGHELQKLSNTSCLTPKDKADALIKAHKVVVDGLTQIPGVELRPEGEPYRPPPPLDSPPIPTPSSDPTVLHPPTPESLSVKSSPSSKSVPLLPDAATHPSGDSPSVVSDASDPLTAMTSEATPSMVHPILSNSPPVPELVLTDAADSNQIQEAMSDSVMALTTPLTRGPSASSRGSAQSRSVPPPNPPKAPKPSTSGADLILPIIIYAVVKSNPPQLASQLMYLRRYRSAICLTGEASYAIVNLTAVVEFLEHVDLAELGLGGDSDKVMSIADLSPIGLDYMDEGNADAASIATASSRLRGRVFQVGELAAGSANKVISGVMDSSWTALRGLIGTNAASPDDDPSSGTMTGGAEGARPGMRPRQASTFSLASVTASVASIAAAAAARNRSRANSRASVDQVWGGNQELVEVASRPASIRERGENEYPSSSEEDSSSEEEEHEDQDGGEASKGGHRRTKSTASAVSTKGGAGKDKEDTPKQERVSLSNRLASIGVLGRLSNPAGGSGGGGEPMTTSPSMADSVTGTVPAPAPIPSTHTKPSIFANLTTSRSASSTAQSHHARRSSLLGGGGGSQSDPARSNSPGGSFASLPITPNMTSITIPTGPTGGGDPGDPPLERFMTCELGDIQLSEIGLLLRDYRRLGQLVNTLQAQASKGTPNPSS
ncbi:hypothetical protein CI109_105174 [Kwoniella shandongensis]|uniref:Uncharacterized protein n=1 Tax=Kwoniella shandongensis TaxID=1734106 RepID=A0A5M6C4B9_9TREE|nr:uncharacterized protein CI109_002015 [Kwoniella shandongensis]KAA5529590.1 hypothetical protein CI109_002015 [Kwoniella shandongensis]